MFKYRTDPTSIFVYLTFENTLPYGRNIALP